MAAAAVVLLLSSPDKARAALSAGHLSADRCRVARAWSNPVAATALSKGRTPTALY